MIIPILPLLCFVFTIAVALCWVRFEVQRRRWNRKYHEPGEWWEIGNGSYSGMNEGMPCCDVCFEGPLDQMDTRSGSSGMWRMSEDNCVLCSRCVKKEEALRQLHLLKIIKETNELYKRDGTNE